MYPAAKILVVRISKIDMSTKPPPTKIMLFASMPDEKQYYGGKEITSGIPWKQEATNRKQERTNEVVKREKHTQA
jgi:hypothetical protein